MFVVKIVLRNLRLPCSSVQKSVFLFFFLHLLATLASASRWGKSPSPSPSPPPTKAKRLNPFQKRRQQMQQQRRRYGYNRNGVDEGEESDGDDFVARRYRRGATKKNRYYYDARDDFERRRSPSFRRFVAGHAAFCTSYCLVLHPFKFIDVAERGT